MTFLQDCRLYLLLTRSLCVGDPLTVLDAALRGGVDLVQVREKPFGEDATAWIDAVGEVCARHDVPLLVNDRPDLVPQTRAVGAHLGQLDLAAFETGYWRERDFVLGISTRDPEQMRRALLEEPDYIGIGPTHPTRTKGYTEALTDASIEHLAQIAPVPAFAIGGITGQNASRLAALGVERVAVSSAILGAADPAAAASALRRAFART